MGLFSKAIIQKKYIAQRKQLLSELNIQKYLQRKYKKTLLLKLKYNKYKKYFLSNKEEWNNKSCYQKLTAIEVSGPSCLAPNITGDQSLQVQLSIHKNDQT